MKNLVRKTSNYKKFKRLKGNRRINPLHAKRIMESMKKKCLFNPIIVNEKMEIIDGQHRFEALKKLKKPVYFLIHEGWGEEEVKILNANQVNWTITDFAEAYARQGLKDYIKLVKFSRENNLSIYMSSIIFAKDRAEGLSYRIKNGEFKIKNEDFAKDLIKKLGDFKELYRGWKNNKFILALIFLLKKDEYDHKKMIRQVKKQPSALIDCVSAHAYLEVLERIYNYGITFKNRVRFF